jgi:hypothetical protein
MPHKHTLSCLYETATGRLACREEPEGKVRATPARRAEVRSRAAAEHSRITVPYPEARLGEPSIITGERRLELPGETRWLDEKAIRRTQIIGSPSVIYTAYEPSVLFAREPGEGHSSTMTLDGRAMGKIGTRRLPADLDALPAYSAERSRAVGEFHRRQYEEAYSLIERAFPEARHGRRRDGEIETILHGWKKAG